MTDFMVCLNCEEPSNGLLRDEMNYFCSEECFLMYVELKKSRNNMKKIKDLKPGDIFIYKEPLISGTDGYVECKLVVMMLVKTPEKFDNNDWYCLFFREFSIFNKYKHIKFPDISIDNNFGISGNSEVEIV